jgi:hypothetical protein
MARPMDHSLPQQLILLGVTEQEVSALASGLSGWRAVQDDDRPISLSVLCPLNAWISCALQPASASRVMLAFRNPCALGFYDLKATHERLEFWLCMPKTASESRNVGHDGRGALLPFEAVGFAVQAAQPA